MSNTYGPRIVSDGLVLHLDAANQRSYVSGSTVWNDLSNNGNNGTLTNGPTFNTDSKGSIVFDGVNDTISGGTLPSITGNNARSVCCWVKTSANKSFQIFDCATIGTYNSSHQVGLSYNGVIGSNPPYNSGSFYLTFYGNDLMYPINYTNIFDGKWHYYSYSYSPTGRKVYVCCDGQFGGTAYFWTNSNTWTTQTGGQPFALTANLNTIDQPYYLGYGRIGIWQGGEFYSQGNLSYFSVYNRALSQSELLQNYNATKGRYGL